MRHPPGSALDDTTLRWPGGWMRVRPWRGAPDVAHLAPGPDGAPGPDLVARCLDTLRERGCTRALTSALAPADARPFVDAGFSVRERLHLLAHDLDDVPRPARGTRRARAGDRAAVLALDTLSFDEFWRLDPPGLDDALHATPTARFRVADTDGRGADGRGADRLRAYAISGRAGRQGYLQRLAVAPSARGQGWGRTVVSDGLRWLRRHGARRAFVNTQRGNEAALALYESCGFRRVGLGLCVLGRTL
jgi:ribosomal protein S18 acetylase RimI-like enzyme